MGVCERCSREFEAYCGKCREEIHAEAIKQIPSDDLFVLLVWDRKDSVYRYGCTVSECPCNTGQGWCSKVTPVFRKDAIEMIMRQLHEFDGDNCIQQWCG